MPRKGPFTSDQLHVIAVISNPARYSSRVRLYREFKQRMLQAGVTLWTIEVAFGDRPFEVTTADDPRNIQLRTFFELWHKENMCNVALQRLPLDWEYVAFVDADISFARPDWALETIQQLQHYYVVQMWQDATDLGPEGQSLERFQSLLYRYVNRLPFQAKVADTYNAFGHPGYAWAYRRDAIENLGNPMDGPILSTPILGAADHHMAMGLIGRAELTIPGDINQAYYDVVLGWQERAVRKLSKDVGYVPGSIFHHWHGAKKGRNYIGRWQILIENDFVPHLDLRRDWQGLWELSDRNPKLRDDLRRYFRQRNEDGVDL